MSPRPLLLAIVFGALTTWAIAARFASIVPDTVMINGAVAAKSPVWTFRQWRSLGYLSNNYTPCFDDRMIPAYEGPKPHLVPWWSRMHRAPVLSELENDLSYVWFNETASGWPLKAFMTDTKYDGRRLKAPNYIVWQRGAWEREYTGWTLRLPYQPIWLGFIANTLIFAAPWFLLLSIPGLFRHRRRCARGLCTRCGYNRSASPGVCPECGSP